jgi:alpha-tubulin suppressor-like RCC1 family protein
MKINHLSIIVKNHYFVSDQHVRKPTPIQYLRGKKVIHVAVGALHCLAVTDSGQIFSWGGKLNTPNQTKNMSETVVFLQIYSI